MEVQRSEPEAVVRRLLQAVDAGRVDEVLAVIHPDAELQPLSADGETLRGPEGTNRWLGAIAGRHASLKHTVERTITLPGDRIVAVGRQQRFEPTEGVSDRDVVWLMQLRDGRLWRSQVCDSLEDALALADAAGRD